MKITILNLLAILFLFQIGCSSQKLSNPNEVVNVFSSSKLSDDGSSDQIVAGICDDKRQDMMRKSDKEIFELASEDEGIGNCYYSANSNACIAYVKVSTSEWPGHGWALNPESQDSTGCVSTTCWGGYTEDMCTVNLPLNAVEQIRDALRHPEDVCGLCDEDRVITVEMILG